MKIQFFLFFFLGGRGGGGAGGGGGSDQGVKWGRGVARFGVVGG